jgi:hypothetical protein
MGCCESSETATKENRRNGDRPPRGNTGNNRSRGEFQGNNANNSRSLDATQQSQNFQARPQSANESFAGEGRKLGGSAAKADAATMAAEAAMRRRQAPIPGLSRETSVAMREGWDSQLVKEALIADIHSLCRTLNEDAPIGLPICNEEQLRSHKKFLEEKLRNKRNARNEK